MSSEQLQRSSKTAEKTEKKTGRLMDSGGSEAVSHPAEMANQRGQQMKDFTCRLVSSSKDKASGFLPQTGEHVVNMTSGAVGTVKSTAAGANDTVKTMADDTVAAIFPE